jgi:hypothetical protein
MAISDFFSGGQTPDYLSGLLDDEQLRRLKANAQQNALMQFGLSALAQGGYSQTPVGIGEILGKAGMAGMQGYQQGIQSGIEGIGTRAKLEEMQRKKKEDAQRKAYMQQFVSTLPEDQRAAVDAMPELGMKLAEKKLIPPDKKYQQVGNQLIDVTGTPTVAFTGEKEVKALPTYKVQQGRTEYTMQVQPDGSEKVIGKGSMDAPQKTSEPSYSIQTDINGKAIYVPNKPGMPSIDAATGKPTVYEPASTPAQEKIKDKATKAATIPTLLNEAKKLIPQATGSKLGNLADEAAATFGESTTGAQKIASLKAIEAQLILNMPRLEGPQGVLDLILYKEAAAQVGNPKIPANTKLAALQTLEDINKRTANPSGGILPKNAPMPKRSKQDILNQYGVNQ